MCSSLNWTPTQNVKQEAGIHVSSVHTETSGWDGLGRRGKELPAGQGRESRCHAREETGLGSMDVLAPAL